MPIKFNCPNCHSAFEAPDDFAGGTGKCETCGKIVRIPHPEVPFKPEPTPHIKHTSFHSSGTPEAPRPATPPRGQSSDPPPQATPVVAPDSPAIDRKILFFVFAVIGLTLVGLAVLVLLKVSRERAEEEATRRITQADALLAEGNVEEAIRDLVELRDKDLPPEIQANIEERLAGREMLIQRVQQESDTVSDSNATTTRPAGTSYVPPKPSMLTVPRAGTVARLGGAFFSFLAVLGTAAAGLALLGVGQLIRAIRDNAVNTYLIAGRHDPDLPRTTPAPDMEVPRYKLIVVLAVITEVLGGLYLLSALVLLMLVVVSLLA